MLVRLSCGDSIDSSLVGQIKTVPGTSKGRWPHIVIYGKDGSILADYPVRSLAEARGEHDILHDLVNEAQLMAARILPAVVPADDDPAGQ